MEAVSAGRASSGSLGRESVWVGIGWSNSLHISRWLSAVRGLIDLLLCLRDRRVSFFSEVVLEFGHRENVDQRPHR
jgi:hypothetical protein